MENIFLAVPEIHPGLLLDEESIALKEAELDRIR